MAMHAMQIKNTEEQYEQSPDNRKYMTSAEKKMPLNYYNMPAKLLKLKRKNKPSV